ncbi:hypothetical protein DSUL_20127 [Desulfovibrionales bacterium]
MSLALAKCTFFWLLPWLYRAVRDQQVVFELTSVVLNDYVEVKSLRFRKRVDIDI